MLKGLLTDLPPLWDVKGWLKAILSREQHPVLQFIRYGIAGVAAMAANLIFFTICIRYVFPLPPESAVHTHPFPERLGELGKWAMAMANDPLVANWIKSNAVAFILANAVAYVLNFKWVFQSGRHSRHLEIALFFGVSLFSFLVGTTMASVLVGTYGINVFVAKMSEVIFAILINFICRKFLVFKNE